VQKPLYLAEAIVGSVKYGGQGMNVSFNGLNLDRRVAEDLEALAIHSLAKKTWCTYKLAERMLATFCKEKKRPLELPTSEKVILEFIHWLSVEIGLKAALLNGYLAGIRKLHIIKGLEAPVLRTQLVQMVLDGKKNMEAASELRNGSKRQPMTQELMTVLKAKIREWDSPNLDKVTLWAASTLLFHGAFRGGEVFSPTAAWFDPAFTLLRRDIVVIETGSGQKSVQVRLKAPKENKQKTDVIVDVFQTDTEMCPIKAISRWQRVSRNMEPDQPAFRFSDGSPVTGGKLLNQWLGEVATGISAHSFRIGAASLMGSLGFSDKDAKAIGRWSSRAFEGYIRTPRTKRRLVAEKVAKYGSK
jgi:hypothetical protein